MIKLELNVFENLQTKILSSAFLYHFESVRNETVEFENSVDPDEATYYSMNRQYGIS